MSGAVASTTGQPEGTRCYAAEQLREAQKRLLDLSQSLVIWRARVEKYRSENRLAAREAFSTLQKVRRDLAEALSETGLLLMEAEEYQTAQTKRFLDKIYEGSAKGLVTNLISADLLTDQEYEELKNLLEEGRGKQ